MRSCRFGTVISSLAATDGDGCEKRRSSAVHSSDANQGSLGRVSQGAGSIKEEFRLRLRKPTSIETPMNAPATTGSSIA